MTIDEAHWEIVRCDGPAGGNVELWDRSLAPGGLAIEVLESPGGDLVLIGHSVDVPLEVAEEFLELARRYLS